MVGLSTSSFVLFIAGSSMATEREIATRITELRARIKDYFSDPDTYARDIVEQQLEATNGIMPVPEGPGIGVTLDRPFLDEVTQSVETLR